MPAVTFFHYSLEFSIFVKWSVIAGAFNDDVRTWDYTTSDNRMVSEEWIGKEVEMVVA